METGAGDTFDTLNSTGASLAYQHFWSKEVRLGVELQSWANICPARQNEQSMITVLFQIN
jgi:hypothetical protein